MKSHEFDVTSKKMNRIAKFVSSLSEGEMIHTATAMLIYICLKDGSKGLQGFYEGKKSHSWKFMIEDRDDFETVEVSFNHID